MSTVENTVSVEQAIQVFN